MSSSSIETLLDGPNHHRSNGKRGTSEPLDSPDQMDCDADQNQAMSIQVAKKPRTEREDRVAEFQSCSPFDRLCEDIIRNIISMINDPRAILNLSLCSKRIRQCVTYENVIRATVFAGNKFVRRSMESLIELLHHQNIYVPTRQRLLRIVNGKRCERGDKCWCYNLRTKRAASVNVVHSSSGLYICDSCQSALFTRFRGGVKEWVESYPKGTTNFGYAVNDTVEELPRTSQAESSCIGPYLTMADFRQICSTHPIGRDDPAPDTERTMQARNEHVEDTLKSYKDADPNFHKGLKLCEIFERARIDHAQREKNKDKADLDRKSDRRLKKLGKYQAIHERIANHLQGTNGKDIALTCQWGQSDAYVGPDYTCTVVRQLMSKLLASPSSATKKAVEDVSLNIHEIFHPIYQHNFFQYDFLSAKCVWENELRTRAVTELSPIEFLSRPLSETNRFPNWVHDAGWKIFKSFVAEGNFRDAFAQGVCFDHDFLAGIFENVAHSGTAVSHPFFLAEDFRQFARSCYKTYRRFNLPTDRFSHQTFGVKTLDELKDGFGRALCVYRDMTKKLIEYLNWELTVTFINSQEFHVRTVRYAIHQRIFSAYEGFGRVVYSEDFDLLRRRDFNSLLLKHKIYAQNIANTGQLGI